jgi:phage tail-like protein
MTELAGSPFTLRGLVRPLVAHDIAVVPAEDGPNASAHLFVADAQGDQAFHFLLGRTGPSVVEPEYRPMRLFGGRGLVAAATGVHYDFGDRWIPLMAQRRPRYERRAVIVSEVFDSREPGCTWHRLLLDACLPPDTQVIVSSAASDERAELKKPAWQHEPRPYRRGDGPERPFALLPRDGRYGTFETLFQAARGRYLKLRLEIVGDGVATPHLRSLRAYHPRFSYLERYLPGVYREDAESAHFLDGFLANVEGFYTTLEDRIASAEQLFEPRTAPSEALDWLASWFDVVLDAGWDDDRRRLFIQHATELFRWRGTQRGLRLALGLALLRCPDERLFTDRDTEPGGIRIVERYQTKRASPALLGDPVDLSLPRTVASGRAWSPNDGGRALHDRWRGYLETAAPDSGNAGSETAGSATAGSATVRYPLAEPVADLGRTWRSFSAQTLGFVPSATVDDAPRWRAFLARRYLRIESLNSAHRRLGATALGSFDEASVPASLPADGPALVDWFAFESVVLRSVRAAHRFSVLLPVPMGRTGRGGVVRAADARDRIAEHERVARLVELEKPAHTVFDVKSFWLAFRVGEARLGRDTLLDYGSRSADLRPPAVVGSMHVGESVLTSATADLPDRPALISGSADRNRRRVARRTDG